MICPAFATRPAFWKPSTTARRIPESSGKPCAKACAARSRLPAFHRHEESSFVHQDDFWTIRYHGHTAFLKCTRGLQCLAVLLRTPGREFHVSEMLATLLEAQVTLGAAMAGNASGRPHQDGVPFVTAGLHDGSPILDAQAKAEYKRRLSELRQEQEEAEQFDDPNRAAKAHDEMNAIAQHLASAIGLGGRPARLPPKPNAPAAPSPSTSSKPSKKSPTPSPRWAITSTPGSRPATSAPATIRTRIGLSRGSSDLFGVSAGCDEIIHNVTRKVTPSQHPPPQTKLKPRGFRFRSAPGAVGVQTNHHQAKGKFVENTQ